MKLKPVALKLSKMKKEMWFLIDMQIFGRGGRGGEGRDSIVTTFRDFLGIF